MEINRCLTDPATAMSDQFMPIAMMPAVVEAIGDIPTIPAPTASANGKVLGVTNGAYALSDPVSELPSIGESDAGKVLTVNASHTGAEWATPSGGASFGPYILQTGTSATITTNGTKVFSPNVITDSDGKSYYIPDDGKAHIFEIASLGMTGYKLTLTGFSTVYDLTHEIAPTVSYRNDSGSSITVPANTTLMEIYSDIPFTEFDEGDA